ncbi:MAG TPA: hypothetical protein VJ739_06825 [Gemmataceae bacterium]|nr:hypothetical protein [Gemmataceae bacterium]
MDVALRLTDLLSMHPLLLWDDIILATVAILADRGTPAPFPLELEVQNLPDFGSARLRLLLDPAGVSSDQVARLRRTYEPSRLIELAAIAVAGLGLYHGGGHEIRDIAVRGSAADYLVGEERYHLEIAGRSRRSDLGTSWQQRWERLAGRLGSGYFVCVVEFETPAGRLAFAV